MGIAVGIDLGTTYSAVAMVDPQTGRARIIPNRDGDAVTPSVVAVMPDNSILIGSEAKEQQESGYTETAAFFKRSMGDENFALPLNGRNYSAKELSSLLLYGLVQQAQEVSGETIDGAYITVPAYFRNNEREATIEAARMAGINVLGILNEPTAAAFAYGINGSSQPQTILVYDLGGGTFDVTLAHVDGNEIKVLASDGNHMLGGKDWDEAVTRWIVDQFEEEFDIDLTEDDAELSQLAIMAENAKKRLTRSAYADITVNYQGHKGTYRLTREIFDDVTSFMLGETKNVVDRLFTSMNPPMGWSQVDGAILVGGSTRMPQVHDYIKEMSGKNPMGGVNVDEAVAIGAAIRANQDSQGNATALPTLSGGTSSPRMVLGGKKITDVTAHALGMIAESPDRTQYVNTVVIPKNTPIPANFIKQVELSVPRSGGRMEVYMLQGDERAPLDNEIAGKYVFENVPYVDGGKSVIDVAYCYNDNGVIEVYGRQSETSVQFNAVREPVPDDMSWVFDNPKEKEEETRRELEAYRKAHAMKIYLMVDLSGSMWGEPLERAIEVGLDFASQIDIRHMNLGVIGFADTEEIVRRPSSSLKSVCKAIRSLRNPELRQRCGGGNTPSSLEILKSAFRGYADRKLAIILTDGYWGDEEPSIQDAHELWNMGIETVAIGFGSASEDFLRKISSLQDLSGLTDLNHLDESFSAIARELNSGNGVVA